MIFENRNDRTLHSEYYLPKVEIKQCNVKIDGKTFYDQPINNDIKTYENIFKIAPSQGSYSRAIQQIHFTKNLDRAGNIKMFFIIKEAKETVLDFSQGTVKVLQNVL